MARTNFIVLSSTHNWVDGMKFIAGATIPDILPLFKTCWEFHICSGQEYSWFSWSIGSLVVKRSKRVEYTSRPMALNTLKCNQLTSLGLKGLKQILVSTTASVTSWVSPCDIKCYSVMRWQCYCCLARSLCSKFQQCKPTFVQWLVATESDNTVFPAPHHIGRDQKADTTEISCYSMVISMSVCACVCNRHHIWIVRTH